MTSECRPEKPHKLFRFLKYLRTDLPSEVRCQELQALWNWQAAGFKAFQGFLAPVLPGGGISRKGRAHYSGEFHSPLFSSCVCICGIPLPAGYLSNRDATSMLPMQRCCHPRAKKGSRP